MTAPQHAAVLLDRLSRLRVCTAAQAHLLSPAYSQRSLRSAYSRLATLVKQRWLVMDAITPSRGATSAYFYRLSNLSIRALGIPNRVTLLERPVQHVLDYLLLRAEVYARAGNAGFYIGSPIFLAEDKRSAALARFQDFLKGRALERLKAGQARHLPPAQLIELRTAVDHLPHFLPKSLDFEFLYSIDQKTNRTNAVFLLLVDDVRRSVRSQVDALPLAAKTDCGIMIRDCDSVYSGDPKGLAFTGTRLFELRRAVAARFGEGLLATDTILPTVWARSTRSASTEAASASSPVVPEEIHES